MPLEPQFYAYPELVCSFSLAPYYSSQSVYSCHTFLKSLRRWQMGKMGKSLLQNQCDISVSHLIFTYGGFFIGVACVSDNVPFNLITVTTLFSLLFFLYVTRSLLWLLYPLVT